MNVSTVAAIAGLMLAAVVHSPRPASDLSGRVLFAGLPVPGVTVTAARGERAIATLSNEDGAFGFTNLEDGLWTVHVEMRGFVPIDRDVTMPLGESPLSIDLKMRPCAEIVAATSGSQQAPGIGPGPPKPAGSSDPPAKATDDPDIINGTQTNGAATPFSQSLAVGNNRPRGLRLYNGNVTTVLANSAWNARPYTFGGPSVPGKRMPNTPDGLGPNGCGEA